MGNNTAHRSASTLNVLQDIGLKPLFLPPDSSTLNFIEWLLGLLKQQWYKVQMEELMDRDETRKRIMEIMQGY